MLDAVLAVNTHVFPNRSVHGQECRDLTVLQSLRFKNRFGFGHGKYGADIVEHDDHNSALEGVKRHAC